MAKKLPKEDQSEFRKKIMQAVDWTYDQAVEGVPFLSSAEELEAPYMAGGGTKRRQANSLIRYQVAKAGTSGFLAGLGGLILMPVSVPANITSVIFIQVRMIAAVAHIGGYDIEDDRVRTLAYACLAGNEIKDVVKDTGIVIGTKMGTKAIERISGETLKQINQRVGFRLVTKFGQTGAVNLGKMVPLAGGIIGGGFDSVSTKIVGATARNTFIPAIA